MKKDVKFYLRQLELADKEEKDWRDRAKKVVELYRSEASDKKTSRFNILWSNVQTQFPALYSATPKPDVRRRYRQEDEVGKAIAIILERALSYSLDSGGTYSFDRVAEKLVWDYLVPGRMVGRVRYHPYFIEREREDIVGPEIEGAEEQEDGTFLSKSKYDELVAEECHAYHVPWKCYRQSPADCWNDVWWVAYGDNFLSQEEIIEQFGAEHEDVPLGFSDEEDDAKEDDAIKKAQVWEIWDKESKQVVAVVKGYDKFLMKEDDPLRLRGFFPGPEPALIIETTSSLIPIPEYTMYQFQAEELNDISERIAKLVSSMKAKGFYPGEDAEKINSLMKSDENILIPVENWAAYAEKGGLKGMIDWLPIQDIVDVWQRLLVQREQIIQAIYQLVGISDIQRGATDPRETRGAQQLKANFGTRRLLPKQQSIQRFLRDLIRLKAEIIAENFHPETLSKITAMPVDEQVVQVMRDDALRSFSVDIETDSTVAPDEEKDKQGVAEFVGSMSAYLQQVAPIVAAHPKAIEPLGKILLWMTRKYKIARDAEADIEGFIRAFAEMPGQQDQAAQAQAQAVQQQAQMEQAEMQQKLQLLSQEKQMKLQLEQQETQASIAREDRESQAEIRRKDMEMQAKIQREALEMQIQQRKAGFEERKAAGQIGITNAKLELVKKEAKKPPNKVSGNEKFTVIRKNGRIEGAYVEGDGGKRSVKVVRENGQVVGGEISESA